MAIKTIMKGEEICVSYCCGERFIMGLRKDRQGEITKKFNFICQCGECSLEGQALMENDKARREYLYKKNYLPQNLQHNIILGYKKAKKMVDIVRKLDIQFELFWMLFDFYRFAVKAKAGAKELDKEDIPNPQIIKNEAWELCQHHGESGKDVFKKTVEMVDNYF